MGKEKRISIFEKTAGIVNEMMGWENDVYFCPICTDVFHREDAKNGTLTEEHVPPKSQGGSSLLLTCEECNSTAGHEIDADVDARNNVNEFLKAVIDKRDSWEGRGSFQMGESKLNVDYSISGTDIRVDIPESVNDPDTIEKYKEIVEESVESQEGGKFKITPTDRYHRWNAKVGDLKTGYLIAVAKYGYSFVASPVYDSIRKQIRNPDDKVIAGFHAYSSRNRSDRNMIYARSPEDLLIVQLERSIVFLPVPTSRNILYDKLQKEIEGGFSTSFKGNPIKFPKEMEHVMDKNLIEALNNAQE